MPGARLRSRARGRGGRNDDRPGRRPRGRPRGPPAAARRRARSRGGGRGGRRRSRAALRRGTVRTCSSSTSTCRVSRASAIPPCVRSSRHPDRGPHDAERPGVRPRGAARRRIGYVLKQAADTELVEAVRLAAAGRTYLYPELGAPARRGAAGRAARRPDRARGRGPAPARARPHERRDRQAALPQRAHGRDPPRAHPAEAPALDPRGARALRARPRARRR